MPQHCVFSSPWRGSAIAMCVHDYTVAEMPLITQPHFRTFLRYRLETLFQYCRSIA